MPRYFPTETHVDPEEIDTGPAFLFFTLSPLLLYGDWQSQSPNPPFLHWSWLRNPADDGGAAGGSGQDKHGVEVPDL